MSGISIFGHVPAIVPGIVGIVAVPISIIGMGTGIAFGINSPQIIAISVLMFFFTTVTAIFGALAFLVKRSFFSIMPPIMSSIAYLLAILSSFFTWMNVGQLSLIAGANCAPSVAACDTGRASAAFCVFNGLCLAIFMILMVGSSVAQKEEAIEQVSEIS